MLIEYNKIKLSPKDRKTKRLWIVLTVIQIAITLSALSFLPKLPISIKLSLILIYGLYYLFLFLLTCNDYGTKFLATSIFFEALSIYNRIINIVREKDVLIPSIDFIFILVSLLVSFAWIDASNDIRKMNHRVKTNYVRSKDQYQPLFQKIHVQECQKRLNDVYKDCLKEAPEISKFLKAAYQDKKSVLQMGVKPVSRSS